MQTATTEKLLPSGASCGTQPPKADLSNGRTTSVSSSVSTSTSSVGDVASKSRCKSVATTQTIRPQISQSNSRSAKVSAMFLFTGPLKEWENFFFFA